MPASDRYRPVVALPPVPGLEFRHLRVPDDFAAMTAIANATRLAAGTAFITTVEDMTNFYAHLSNCDLVRDVFTVAVADDLIGYGRCFWYDLQAGGRTYPPICFLAPAWRRQRIGIAMLRTLEARIAEIAAEDPVEPAWLEIEVDAANVGHTALVQRAGYEPVRQHYTMVRPDLQDQHDAPMPPGLEIREVQPDHMRAIWDADQEAFADHWGAGFGTEADYEDFRSNLMAADTRLWRIAWDGDQVAGQVRSFINPEENRLYDRRRGWVEHISVRQPWRHRGLARALIAASLPLLRTRGMTEGALTVDTENLSGALRVYESMGFQPVGRETTYRKPLDERPQLGPD